ncbi:transglycosylase domain-containing protein [Modestobacter sp. L9-4]|uniref:biosynthetic peptidoglycan transglycosylase n=1 Tax=Modestobacter sp. L9-4 TaxID=2851567 RepID=UPI001C785FE4|nr:biosynthetic peptidoglycan transglycosylase [Modestobacter sp. L9-4]QXG76684.1 transglycosylase domain-containing protein [Modestobacter sp. L9-4]
MAFDLLDSPEVSRPQVVRRSRGARVRRGLRRAALALLVLVALAVGVGWVATPSVDDAPDRVTAFLMEHQAPALTVAPASELVDALVAVEDSSFHSNPGISPSGVVRSFRGLVTGTDEGGSTLPQQLAKNLYLDGRNGPVQKAEAVVLALKLDGAYSKTELLEMYLDDGYYGHGFYGLTAATQGYFGVAPDQLTWAQSSLLAGLFQAPTAYDPLVHPDLARERQLHVLDRLVAVGDLTRAQADDAAAADWGLVTG